MAAEIEAEARDGARSGVNTTPTFFIQGIRYEGVRSYPRLLQALSAATTEASC